MTTKGLLPEKAAERARETEAGERRDSHSSRALTNGPEFQSSDLAGGMLTTGANAQAELTLSGMFSALTEAVQDAANAVVSDATKAMPLYHNTSDPLQHRPELEHRRPHRAGARRTSQRRTHQPIKHWVRPLVVYVEACPVSSPASGQSPCAELTAPTNAENVHSGAVENCSHADSSVNAWIAAPEHQLLLQHNMRLSRTSFPPPEES